MRAPFAALLLAVTLALAGCGTTEVTEQPAFYNNLSTGKPVDAVAAASLISDYRTARGLPAVSVDPTLTRLAQDQANAMAKADKLDHTVNGRDFISRIKASGYDPKGAVENVGAGYHTLAEAFSGWRDSPSHNKNMLAPGMTRMGIATAYSAKSKYKVFWALILAEPDTPAAR